MIKLTLKDLQPLINSDSLNHVMNLSLPARESYRLGVAAKIIQERITVYEQARQNLVRKYGETVASEGVIRVKPEHIATFQNEMEGLQSEVVELNLDPMPISLLGDSKLSPMDMANLLPFFIDDSR